MNKPLKTGQPFNYQELAEYQEGSVVSRTIIDKKSGTVTLFAFDNGQKLSTHSAPFDALVQIVEGEGLIVIDKKECRIKAPLSIIMPADVPHSVHAEERFKMLLVMIRQ